MKHHILNLLLCVLLLGYVPVTHPGSELMLSSSNRRRTFCANNSSWVGPLFYGYVLPALSGPPILWLCITGQRVLKPHLTEAECLIFFGTCLSINSGNRIGKLPDVVRFPWAQQPLIEHLQVFVQPAVEYTAMPSHVMWAGYFGLSRYQKCAGTSMKSFMMIVRHLAKQK